MNTLSFAIYLFGVLGNLLVLLSIISLIGAFAFFVTLLRMLISWSDNKNFAYYNYNGNTPTFKQYWSNGYKNLKRLAIAVIISSTLLIFLPTQQTMLMIAANEIGEKAITSELGNNTLNYANEWLKKEIDNLRLKQEKLQPKPN